MYKLPVNQLQGSDKQVAWATQIVNDMSMEADKYITDAVARTDMPEVYRQIIVEVAEKVRTNFDKLIVSASYVIDNRRTSTSKSAVANMIEKAVNVRYSKVQGK